ncbi:3'-5' exonuclease [Rhodococcus pyridinivorans]|uniref:3'-5' exonuclease n=1 Tax=Rhodococcus pyridinivorans TaxID=103816 RepID=UPI002078F193|nr:3'-5' exonuclease [Rhodococcus pyridinivorans]USI93039.1 3'-5' exonuclease [Rhodococcus pyridinivorans]
MLLADHDRDRGGAMPLQIRTPRAWANAVLADGAACIVDVETSGLDGSIIEIAVIDAATGEVLLDTLVDCSPVEIEPGAVEVHGLTATDLAGAPRWPEVFATLAAVTASRVVLAYNAKFDRGRVLHDCRREGIDPAHLAEPARWQCVMARRCEALGLGPDGRLRLGGGHRALADVRATRAVLRMLADGRPDTDGFAALAIRVREEAREVAVDSRSLGRRL